MFKQKSLLITLRGILATWIIAAGWSWYHVWKHPKWIFVGKACLIWIGLIAAYALLKWLYTFCVQRFKAPSFWKDDFYKRLDTLFLIGSLSFGIFFSTNEIVTLVVSVVIFWLFFRQLQKMLSRHPNALEALKVNRTVWMLGAGIFAIQAVCQLVAYHYYILDSNIKFYDIVFFRTFVMTLFWLLGFALASVFFQRFMGWVRYALFVIWSIVFVFNLAAWMFNAGILYYSALYLSPVALENTDGAGGVVFNPASIVFAVGLLAAIGLFVWLLVPFITAQKKVRRTYWFVADCLIIVLALGAIVSLQSFRNTPEAVIVKSFYDAYIRQVPPVKLDPAIVVKLQKFGLNYNPDAFYVNDRATVFAPTTTPLLPAKFATTKPNIVFVYVESFSARFSGVYNPAMTGVTPNIDAFAADPHTTVFTNYYNASTPTITGTLSQQCSFLPPTGENEIENQKELQSHRLLCLPEVLKKDAGYKYAAYITAVDKDFAHKDGIFTSMDVDKVFGTDELKSYISAPPLAWGYSDHQMFPVLWQMMQTAPQPFDLMMQTIDTHPPFNLAKDAVNYGDGKNDVLNMFHTTDDAFGKFWTQFKTSPFYQNTIVVVVADHAIFPGAVTSDLFPKDAGKISYYDQNFFAMYVPDSILPKQVNVLSSGLDEVPTILQMLNVNVRNSFEGHSVFDDRSQYPNLLGMHELGLYINQTGESGKRQIDYNIPSNITCPANYSPSSTPLLTECDFLQFYEWKRQMFDEGRFWKH